MIDTDPTTPTFLASVLKTMSDGIAGGTADSTMATADFLGAEQFDSDEPDDPMEPDELGQETWTDDEGASHTADDGHDHSAGSSSRYAWGDHKNGRIPAKELTAIGQGSHKLETGAAGAWSEMRADAAEDGVTLKLTDSYRTYAQQVSVRKRKGHLVATAKPGTSVHGWGRAVDADVSDAETLAWLRSNASRYGWVNPAWAQRGGKSYEPWHFEWQGGED